MRYTAALPPEFRPPDGTVGRLPLAAAMGPDAILVVGSNALARYDLALGAPAVGVPADGAEPVARPRRMAALPDGRFLLCHRYRTGEYVDNGSLTVTLATDLVCVPPETAFMASQRETHPRDAFVVDGQLLLGHGSNYCNVDEFQYFTAVQAAPAPWLADLPEQVRRAGVHPFNWYVVRGTAMGDTLVLACQGRIKGKSSGHSLLRVSADGTVLRLRPYPRERVRDDALELAADGRRATLTVYSKGALDILDERLDTLVSVEGHPFLTRFRLLCGDGQGRLLWFGTRADVLLLTDGLPEEPTRASVDAFLDGLAETAAQAIAELPRRAPRPRSPRVPSSDVRRHVSAEIPPSTFIHARRNRLLGLLGAARPDQAQVDAPPRPDFMMRAIADLAHQVLADASIYDREDPILWTAVRALAQGSAGQLTAHASFRVRDEVQVPLGDRSISVPTSFPIASVSLVTWVTGWYAALIARDDACRTLLATVPNRILEVNGVTAHIEVWREALQGFDANPGSVEPLVAKATSLTAAPSFATTWAVHRAHSAVYPMLVPIVRGDPDGLHAAMSDALLAHRRYWGKREPGSYRGWVALGPLAMCCLAADRGIPVRVDSEYLVPYLIGPPPARPS
jgi:hypothetical protein